MVGSEFHLVIPTCLVFCFLSPFFFISFVIMGLGGAGVSAVVFFLSCLVIINSYTYFYITFVCCHNYFNPLFFFAGL